MAVYLNLDIWIFGYLGVFEDFLNSRFAVEYGTKTVVTQASHALFQCFLLNRKGRRPIVDQFANRIRDNNHFKKTNPAAVAGITALGAAITIEEVFVGDL